MLHQSVAATGSRRTRPTSGGEGAVRLGPGMLYRTIGRLLADGLIEETGGSDPDAPHDARRRRYQLTPSGRDVAEREAASMARLVAHAAAVGLLRSPT